MLFVTLKAMALALLIGAAMVWWPPLQTHRGQVVWPSRIPAGSRRHRA